MAFMNGECVRISIGENAGRSGVVTGQFGDGVIVAFSIEKIYDESALERQANPAAPLNAAPPREWTAEDVSDEQDRAISQCAGVAKSHKEIIAAAANIMRVPKPQPVAVDVERLAMALATACKSVSAAKLQGIIADTLRRELSQQPYESKAVGLREMTIGQEAVDQMNALLAEGSRSTLTPMEIPTVAAGRRRLVLSRGGMANGSKQSAVVAVRRVSDRLAGDREAVAMTEETTTQLSVNVAAQLAYYVGGPVLFAYFLFQLFTQVMH